MEFKLFDEGGGRWGVETTSQTREVFIALASLIRAGRHEMALAILDNELNSHTSSIHHSNQRDGTDTHHVRF